MHVPVRGVGPHTALCLVAVSNLPISRATDRRYGRFDTATTSRDIAPSSIAGFSGSQKSLKTACK